MVGSMDKLIEEYRKHPSKFIEDIYGIHLFKCQKFYVDNVVGKIQNLHIPFLMNCNRLYYFRTLRELEKYIEDEIINEN